MGVGCFSICGNVRSMYDSPTVSPPKKPNIEQTQREIETILHQNLSMGPSLNMTLKKYRNLHSICAHMTPIRNSGRSIKTADQAMELKFSLSSRADSHSLAPNKDQRQKDSTLNVAEGLCIMETNSAMEIEENAITPADNVEPRRPEHSKTLRDEENQCCPQRKFRFVRKDFFRIVKANPTDFFTFKYKIGEGAQGTVYRAIDKRTSQDRAIKVILKNKVSKKSEFFAEFETLRLMDHPNIVKLYEIIEHNNHYYIITEFCSGGQVVAQVKRIKCFSEKSVALIMRDLLSAVVYIHENNIIHRDLKLENMVFERPVRDCDEELPPPVKLVDFGTCKLLKSDRQQMLYAQAGTPLYMAPEVIQNRYNNKCDVWSCGVIMYMLLSGKPPFRGSSRKAVFKKIEFDAPSFTSSVWDRISDEAKTLIQRMLEKNSRFRISAAQVLSSNWIRNCSAEEPISNKVLRDMERHYFKDKFIAVVLTYLASNAIPQHRRRDLAKIFMKLDANLSGTIEKTDLVQVYKKEDDQIDERLIDAIFNNIDTDNSGKIDFTEFLVVVGKQEQLLRRDHLERAFEFFNRSGTGYLSLEEVKAILGEYENEQVERIMTELDLNKDHRVSKQEFVQRMLKYGGSTEIENQRSMTI